MNPLGAHPMRTSQVMEMNKYKTMDDFDKRLAGLEVIYEDLNTGLQNLRVIVDDDRKTVKKMQLTLNSLKGPLQRALTCLMPKVEALLHDRGLQQGNNLKHTPLVSKDSSFHTTTSSSKETSQTTFLNPESASPLSESVSTHTDSGITDDASAEVNSGSFDDTTLFTEAVTPAKLLNREPISARAEFFFSDTPPTLAKNPPPVVPLTVATLSRQTFPSATESTTRFLNTVNPFTPLVNPIHESSSLESNLITGDSGISQTTVSTDCCGLPTRSSNSDRSGTQTSLLKKGSPTGLGAMVLSASESGDAFTLLRLLEDDADFCERNEEGNTALHLASSCGHERCVVFLLGSGAKVDTTGDRLRTPLHCAATAGHERVVRRLLLVGASPDVKDADGDTPLMMASRCGYVDIVTTLLQHKASLTEYSKQGDTPLLIAIKTKQWAVAEVLIQEGLARNGINENNNSAIVCAAKAGKWSIVDLLLQKGAPPGKFKDWETSPLVMAAEQGEVKILRKILSLPQKPTEEEMTEALARIKDFSVLWAFEEEVRGILRGKTGQKGMWRAAKNGLSNSLSLLLHAGVDVNSVNDVGAESALHLAIENCKYECVRELVNRGANVHLKNEHGDTALHYASRKGQKEVVCLLLEAGADASSENAELDTPLNLARSDSIKSLLLNFNLR